MAAFSYHPHHDPFALDVADFPSDSHFHLLFPPTQQQQHQQRRQQAGDPVVSSSAFFPRFYCPFDSLGAVPVEMSTANTSTAATPASSSSLESARVSSRSSSAQRSESQREKKRKDDQKCNSSSSQLKKRKNTKQKKCSRDAESTNEKRALKEPPTGYIHVRARRGQATDSHSLAERVRREKIRERMKMLQGLVPGCDKVIGKALLLDEIINYVQSLQNQVEFLSMKLASLNPVLYELGLDSDGYMLSPESDGLMALILQKLEEMSLGLPNIQQTGPHQATAFADTADSCPVQDSSVPFLLHEEGPAPFHQGNGGNFVVQLDHNRESLFNQVDFNSVPSSYH
ncbi:unnamed protein product [Spirodela intermedia]|uniref:BHLH domain-containing protein n=1 Tax=Spirodela intermedia TaxID=51605 RepID=A0A7I8KEX9_SPIIN|nr:unnamed protein product [Spirodela intermedia]